MHYVSTNIYIIKISSGKNQPLLLHQYSGILKAILAELQERKEDYDKLREKLDRLEVILFLFTI